MEHHKYLVDGEIESINNDSFSKTIKYLLRFRKGKTEFFESKCKVLFLI